MHNESLEDPTLIYTDCITIITWSNIMYSVYLFPDVSYPHGSSNCFIADLPIPHIPQFRVRNTAHIYLIELNCFNRPFLLWIFLVIVLVIVRASIANGFVCQSLFINNSVTPDKLGAVNGLAITVTSLFRYICQVCSIYDVLCLPNIKYCTNFDIKKF